MEKINEYEKAAIDFLNKTGVEFEAQFVGHDLYFDDDKEPRDIYKITLGRGKKVYSFRFGQSIVNSGAVSASYVLTDKAIREGRMIHKTGDYERKRKAPTAYDVLACLQKCEPGDFESFCGDFGYDTDSRKAEKAYHALQKEYKGVCSIWNEEERMELADIN